MDVRVQLLEQIKQQGSADMNLLGLFHVLIGRRIESDDGNVVSNGTTWRELASLLKKVRWNRDDVKQLGQEPSELPPRDRDRFWYASIAQANVDSDAARQAGDKLALELSKTGYKVGPPPSA